MARVSLLRSCDWSWTMFEFVEPVIRKRSHSNSTEYREHNPTNQSQNSNYKYDRRNEDAVDNWGGAANGRVATTRNSGTSIINSVCAPIVFSSKSRISIGASEYWDFGIQSYCGRLRWIAIKGKGKERIQGCRLELSCIINWRLQVCCSNWRCSQISNCWPIH